MGINNNKKPLKVYYPITRYLKYPLEKLSLGLYLQMETVLEYKVVCGRSIVNERIFVCFNQHPTISFVPIVSNYKLAQRWTFYGYYFYTNPLTLEEKALRNYIVWD